MSYECFVGVVIDSRSNEAVDVEIFLFGGQSPELYKPIPPKRIPLYDRVTQ